MFGINEFKKVVGQNITFTSDMVDSINLWNNMLLGNATWNGKAPSLGIPSGIVREFADICVNEMEASCINENVDAVFQEVLEDLNENLQDGLALGSFIIKPIRNNNGSISVEFINADQFAPISFDAKGRVTDCLFVQTKRIKKDLYYHRCERHKKVGSELEITNTCYRSVNSVELQTQVPLAEVEEWAEYPELIVYPVDIMDFGFFKTPIKNRIDGSGCGVSLYNSAIELIQKADVQGARIDWEFESGERAIHVDERALKHKNGKAYLPDKKLYRGLDIDGGNGELFKEYSPALRQSGYIEGLESYLRQIEFNVGLAYGDLSNVNYVDKTAAEIKHSKQRKYNRVTAIQKSLETCLREFVEALAFYMGTYKTDHTLNIVFNDSILSDEEAERNQDRLDVTLGVMSLAEYRMKWYNEDKATAEASLPTPAGLIE